MNKRSKDTAAAVNQALRGAEARLYALEEIRGAYLEALENMTEQTKLKPETDRERQIWQAATATAYRQAANWLDLEN